MATTSAQAIYGLTAIGTPTSVNVDGAVTIGKTQTSTRLTSANIAYCVTADLMDTETLTLNVATGVGTSTGSDVAAALLVNPDGTNNSFDVTAVADGTRGNLLSIQILSPIVSAETTATLVGGAQMRIQPGTKARMIVTGTLTDGTNPVTFPTLFYAGDTGGSAIWSSDGVATAAVSGAWYSVVSNAGAGESGDDWYLSKYVDQSITAQWTSSDSAYWPDGLGLDASTPATGTPTVTAATSSAAQGIAAMTASTAVSNLATAAANGTVTGALAAYPETFLAGGVTALAGGAGKDFQGDDIATLTTLYGLQVNVTSGSAHASNGTQSFPLPAQFFFAAGDTSEMLDDDLVITATADNTFVQVIVLGS